MQNWKKNFLITAGVFALLSSYLLIRRGYFNIFIANKAVASTAAVIAGLTLLLGFFAKRGWLATWLPQRKTLGITALGLVVLHVFFSLVLLNDRFPVKWMVQEKNSMIAGVSALSIWIFLGWISRPSKELSMGSNWRPVMGWGGRVSFVLVYLHLVVMKLSGWIKWWKGEVKQTPELLNPQMPPASTFVFVIMTLVIAVKVYEIIISKKNNALN